MSLKNLNVYVPSSNSDVPVQALYGVPQYSIQRGFSFLGIIILFIIGLIVLLNTLLNRKKKKKAKIIVLSIIAVAIIVLVLLNIFVFV